ncbi:MAG: hypothetical protein ACREIV_07620, partial [Planctomycetaceae bacterium]
SRLDRLGDALAYSKPGRTLATMFDPSAMDRSTVGGQRLARELYPRLSSAEDHVKAETTAQARTLQQRGLDSPEALREQRAALEGVGQGPQEFDDIARWWDETANYELAANAEAGLKPYNALEDVIDPATARRLRFVPRKMTTSEARRGAARGPFSGKDPAAVGRRQVWKGFAQGSQGVNDLLMDEELNDLIELGIADEVGEKTLRQRVEDAIAIKYGQEVLPEYQVAKGNKLAFTDANGRKAFLSPQTVRNAEQLPDGSIEVTRLNGTAAVYKPLMESRYKQLALKMIRNPRLRDEGLFHNSWLADVEDYMTSNAKRRTIASGIYDFVADSDNLSGRIGRYPTRGADRQTVGQLFQKLGLDVDVAAKHVLERRGIDPAALDAKAIKQAVAAVKRETIDDGTFEDVAAVFSPAIKGPENISSAAEFVDSMTNLFKVGVLTWPARYVRDLVSAQVRNMETGRFSRQGLVGAFRVLKGGTIPGAAEIGAVRDWMLRQGAAPAAITDESATEAIRNIYAAFGPG